MNLNDIKTIAVCGAGTMGSGIAQLCAAAGFKTILYDINEAAVHKGLSVITHNLVIAVEKNKITEQEKRNTLSRIQCTVDLAELKIDLLIEAVIEKKEIKQ